jgi:hypothetical protein
MTGKRTHETSDASPKLVVIALAGILTLLALGLGLTRLALPFLEGGAPPAPPPQGPTTLSAIPLEAAPGATLTQVRARGLIKLKDGPVPIDQAMAQVAQRGWADPEAAP